MTEIQREQIAAYERRGPFWGRLTQFAAALGFIASLFVCLLVIDTLAGFYPGTGAVKSTPAERPVEAIVGDCQWFGPVSGNGLGCW